MPEYKEGPEAKEKFEQAMQLLFQAPKPKKPKKRLATLRKAKRTDKD